MRYESEILYDLMKRDGLLNPSQDNLPYESELKEMYVDEVEGAYPKLQDYRAEWLNYAYINPIGEFPYVTLTDVTNATIENVVPYAYKSAILKGDTKFIDEYGVEHPSKSIFHSSYFEQGTIGGAMGSTAIKENSTTRIRTINPLALEKGSYSITVRADYEVYVKIIDSTNNIGIRQGGFDSFISFNITDSSKEKVYIVFRKSDSGNITTDEVEGIVSSSTIPELTSLSLVSVKMPILTTSNEDGTKTNILSCNEEVELRGIGEVKDELDLMTGEVTEHIGEIVLDGTENWTNQSLHDRTNTKRYILSINDTNLSEIYSSNSENVNFLSNFKTTSPNNRDTDIEAITMICWNATTKDISIRVNKTTVNSLDEFKNWLSQNPITVQYQLATESIKTVDLTILDQNGSSLSQIKPIEGTMNLTTSSDTIAPTFSGEIPVEAITQNIASFVE